MHFTLFLNVLFKDINLSNTREVTGNCKGRGQGWHQKPNLLEKVFMLEFLVGWERGFETPKKCL